MEERRVRVLAGLQAGLSPQEIADQEGISLPWALRNIERAVANQDPEQVEGKPLRDKSRLEPALRLAVTCEDLLEGVDRLVKVLDRLEGFHRLREPDAGVQEQTQPI
jgi:hypothetical protein